MKKLTSSLCLLILSAAFAVPVSAELFDGVPHPYNENRKQPKEAPYVDPEKFESALNDQYVQIRGEWSEELKQKLRDALELANPKRASEELDAYSMTLIYKIRFELGPAFDHQMAENVTPNTGSIWGVGFSGHLTNIYTLPPEASVDEIATFLSERLPPINVRNTKKLESHQNRIAAALRGDGFCAGLLRAFGLRR